MILTKIRGEDDMIVRASLMNANEIVEPTGTTESADVEEVGTEE